jgi:spore coat protein A, manganese oxidase
MIRVWVFSLVLSFTVTGAGANPQSSKQPPSESKLEKFVDDLTIPENIKVDPSVHELTIHLNEFKHKFHRDLPLSTAWGYNVSTPGPTIEVESRQNLKINWQNDLPKKHILPMDKGMDMMGAGLPESREVTHLHGAFVSQPDTKDRIKDNDGWPDAWTTGGQAQQAEYKNEQGAATLWYHDHAIGITGRNVYAGLEGFYLVHDDLEKTLNLPNGSFDVPLMIQSRSFASDGSMIYPREMPSEVYGDTITVNGKVWPRFKVKPRRYRFRFLNAANARSFALMLFDHKTGAPGPRFYQIGSDGGFLERPIILNDPKNEEGTRLQLAPGERADVIVDFSKFSRKDLRLENSALLDEPALGPLIKDVMLFQVGSTTKFQDVSEIPKILRSINRTKVTDAVRTRQIILSATEMADGKQMMLLNGKYWKDPITERPALSDTEIWELVNLTDDNHPFHIHSVHFQILDRRPFDTTRFKPEDKSSLHWTGPAQLPNPNEMGWKDTVVSSPGDVTRIIVKFSHFSGFYVYHCHVLEHEDMDMMRPFEVTVPETSSKSKK